jgi:hypothetical protein
MCASCIPCASPGRPHRSALSNQPLPVHPLPPTSFQSLMRLLRPGWFCGTNRLKLVATLFVHFVPSYLVCFHTNMNCPVCKSFVLITMRIARGVGIPLRSHASSKALTPAPEGSALSRTFKPTNLQTCKRANVLCLTRTVPLPALVPSRLRLRGCDAEPWFPGNGAGVWRRERSRQWPR